MTRHPSLLLLASLWLFILCSSGARAQGPGLVLPTSNTALLTGNDSSFYQHTISGRENPWLGGTYGFVRNPRGTSEGIVYTRYHGGLDIKPLYRDARGEPLDSVRAVAEGRVVHANAVAGLSNYGRYVVVEHFWNGSPYYTLYAHLSEVWAEPGAMVRQGDLLGRMGHTGDGINRARAHLHFEINLLLNENFDEWLAQSYSGATNHHGNYNGLNLVGIDPARLYKALLTNPNLTIPEYLQGEEAFFEVEIPITQRIDLLRRYPWLQSAPAGPEDHSWKLAFTRYGLPVCISPSTDSAADCRLCHVCFSSAPYRLLTKSLLSGSGDRCSLSGSGERYMRLLTSTAAVATGEAEEAGEDTDSQ
ncbi:MAG: M23 family metallopeptidase [Candidatus Kapaibacterium sp.]